MDVLPLPAGRLGRLAPLTAEEVAAHVVAAAVWAPSVHNTQPWWFSAARQEISLHADAGRQLTVADPDGREIVEGLLLDWERRFEGPQPPGSFCPDVNAVRRLLNLPVPAEAR